MKLRIDNIDIESDGSQTLLDLAAKAGINIPVLCNRDGIEPWSSCMVCIVKDNKTGRYIPSCTAIAEDGMDIDASGAEVAGLRKKSLELLLSEHRAECEAPCRIVCPGGYNIPELNRLLLSGNFSEAVELLHSELDSQEIKCTSCPGYCENACRRKKLDTPVSIKNIHQFVFQSINRDKLIKETANQINNNTESRHSRLRKRFSSRIGKLEENEFKEWLKESSVNGKRYREINDVLSARAEADSCMHCDCRAADNCMLRDLAEKFSLKDPVGKMINAPIIKKINYKTGLIFENAKCIKCGLCVRVCEDSNDEQALCFINRGFVSVISEPLTVDFEETMATKADICITVCPTGALSYFK
jgi:predicted molibdopterin-dependent oxidoreductase YjgC